MYQALHEEERMLVYGSLTGEPTRVGADPRFITERIELHELMKRQIPIRSILLCGLVAS